LPSSVITEGYFIIAALIIASVLSANVLYSTQQISQAYVERAKEIKNKAMMEVVIIFATGSNNSDVVYAWVKNVGKARIPSNLIEKSDLFFGPLGNFERIPYNASSPPSWNYTIVNDLNSNNSLDPQETISITIQLSYNLTTGDYYLRFATYSGAYDEYEFSI
jgi:flagellar protein FlaG